ncbi:hypothetical protein Q9233_005392 [Columba guinea]|nr:hypothetical protein Q9233_005392 [Columba guinea]
MDVSGPIELLAWPGSVALSVRDGDVSVNKSDIWVRRTPPAGAAPREPRTSGSFRMEVPEHLNSERR